jgi:hypothetical protein
MVWSRANGLRINYDAYNDPLGLQEDVMDMEDDFINDPNFLDDVPEYKMEKIERLLELLNNDPSSEAIEKAGRLLDEFIKFNEDEANSEMDEAEAWMNSLIGILEGN